MLSIGVNATAKLPVSISIAAPEIPPLVYFDEKQQLVGVLVEKFNLFSHKTGIQVSIEIMTWARALAQVQNNKHDALMPAIKTPEREFFLAFPKQALINFKSSILIKRKSQQQGQQSPDKSPEALVQGKTIAKARSMLLGDDIDALITRVKPSVVEVNSVEDALQMLDLGRVDFVATDKAIALSVINKLSLADHFEFIKVGVESSDSYLAFSQEFAKKYDIEKLMEAILAVNESDIFTLH